MCAAALIQHLESRLLLDAVLELEAESIDEANAAGISGDVVDAGNRLFRTAGGDPFDGDSHNVGEGFAPVALHPANPRYFIYNNRPTTMVTSGEHYGAVLNLDFNYITYLDTLAADGLNHTRTFSGTYREIPGTFNITRNTLAPAPNRYLAPWKRSTTLGYYDGGNKFDLNQWDENYFARLKDFVVQAEQRGIFVEFTLFCVLYNDSLWSASPMNAANNVNGVGAVSRSQALTLNNGGLLAYQTAFVQKIVKELNSFSNVLFEICNEPYIASYAAGDWQRLISSTIRNTENALANRHLIAQNVGDGAMGTHSNPDPNVDVFQYHYIDPTTIYNNYGIAKPIGNNETGFDGVGIDTYRHQGWETMLAGGAVYSNLDYSFAAGGWENGTFAFPSGTPGSGGVVLRDQIGHLKSFMDSIPFINMSPNNAVIKGGIPTGVVTRTLAKIGSAYATYFRGGTQVSPIIEMPAGRYKAEWINTKTGKVDRTIQFKHAGGNTTLASPTYSSDIALRVRLEAKVAEFPPTQPVPPSAKLSTIGPLTGATFASVATSDFALDDAMGSSGYTEPYDWI
jgi:hypothetical protein